MGRLFYFSFLLILSCASPTAFMGNGILSLGTTQSINKAIFSSGTDYLIKKQTGKNKVEYLSSKFLKKDCIQEKNIKLSCK